ncbi:MAG: hypothetical protein ACHQ1H_01730, partial [Nitrososphaerales archaeon]
MILSRIAHQISQKYFRVLLSIVALILIVAGIYAMRTEQSYLSSGESTTISSTILTSSSTCAELACTFFTAKTTSTSIISTSTIITSSQTTSATPTETATSMTVSTTTASCTPANCRPNPLWNANSQQVATWVANHLFNSQVGMIATSSFSGCRDYVGGLPCVDTFWTTSDNVPTAWTLQDFGYSALTSAVQSNCTRLLCSTTNSGNRYEAYVGWPIAVGSPGDQHAVFNPGSSSLTLCTSTGGCGKVYGSFVAGTNYKLQADVWNGNVGTPNPNGAVDVVGPQAVNYYIRGDMTDALKFANALVARWNGYSVDGSGGGATWHLGQVMFVMRVLKLDNSTQAIKTALGSQTYSQVFQQMVKELWAIQAAYKCSGGCLPNQYKQSSPKSAITGTS